MPIPVPMPPCSDEASNSACDARRTRDSTTREGAAGARADVSGARADISLKLLEEMVGKVVAKAMLGVTRGVTQQQEAMAECRTAMAAMDAKVAECAAVVQAQMPQALKHLQELINLQQPGPHGNGSSAQGNGSSAQGNGSSAQGRGACSASSTLPLPLQPLPLQPLQPLQPPEPPEPQPLPPPPPLLAAGCSIAGVCRGGAIETAARRPSLGTSSARRPSPQDGGSVGRKVASERLARAQTKGAGGARGDAHAAGRAPSSGSGSASARLAKAGEATSRMSERAHGAHGANANAKRSERV